MNAFLVDHIRFFQERGLQVFMMVPPSDVAPSAEFGADRLISVSIQRNISILSDLLGVYRLWRVMRRVRPSITNMTTPKMGLLGGIAGLLARVPYRVYTLRGYRFETSRGLKRLVLLAAEWAACRCAHTVILISRSVEVDGIRLGLFEPGKGRLLGETMSEGL